MNIKLIIKEELNNILKSFNNNSSNHILSNNPSNNTISESLSDIVYHFTYIPHLINILKINKFATSSNLGSNADAWKDRGRFFFFSTQRTKGSSGYGSRHGSNVSIVLDGRKLNQNYKGFPTDYWNWSKDRNMYSSNSEYKNALLSAELEDRIVTNKPYIDNASKYIIEIHVFINPNHTDKKDINDINNLTSQYNIPVYFYTDETNYKLQNKTKAIAPENLDIPNEIERYESDRNIIWDFKSLAPYIIAGRGGIFNESAIHELLKKYLVGTKQINLLNDIIKEIDDKVKRINTSWGYSRSYWIDDTYRALSSDIHNNRGNPNPYYRELLKILVNDMRKIRAKNLKEYLEIKSNKTNDQILSDKKISVS